MSRLRDYINKTRDIGEVYYDIFNANIPSGKMFCPCPTHNNVNTPAAKRYQNVIHCFSCNKTYTPYDLLKWYQPQKIEEIKGTEIVDVEDTTKINRIKIMKIDRNKPIEQIIDFILKNNG